MAIEKINSFASNVRFGQAETVKSVETPNKNEDKEKSSAMGRMIGLGALAAITIGGIILYAKKGKTPSTSGTSAPSGTPTPTADPIFEPFKKFMKKLEDGTEYLFREETRDKDGHLVKSVRYSPDGKVERVREFKMAPAGVTDPARNVVASEIRYDKEGKIIYRRTENPDFSGYVVEEIPKDEPSVLAKYTVEEKFDGHRFRAREISGTAVNRETGIRVSDVTFGPKGKHDVAFARMYDDETGKIVVKEFRKLDKGCYSEVDFKDGKRVKETISKECPSDEDDIELIVRKFDRKTGTKVVFEKENLGDGSYKITNFGKGKSKVVVHTKKVEGSEEEVVTQYEQYDSEGRLRMLFTETQGGSFTRVANPAKGRTLIVEEENGVKHLTRTYQKKGVTYTQKFIKDEVNPENSRIEVYKGDELVRVVTTK